MHLQPKQESNKCIQRFGGPKTQVVLICSVKHMGSIIGIFLKWRLFAQSNKIQVWLRDGYHLHSLKGTLSKPGDPDAVVEDNIKLAGWATGGNRIRQIGVLYPQLSKHMQLHNQKPNQNPQREHQQHLGKPSHSSFWTATQHCNRLMLFPQTLTCANRAPVAVDANGKVNAT